MEKLMQKLHELLNEAQGVIGQYKAKLVIVDDREKLLEQKESDFKVKKAQLDKRESAVNTLENIKQANEDIDDRSASLAKAQDDFTIDKQKFSEYKSEQSQLLDNRKVELDEREKNLDEREAGMEKKMNDRLDSILKNAKITINK